MAIRRSAGRRDKEVDRTVGQRIRNRRILLGMTQEALGEAIGVTYQQMAKYEAGANTTRLSRLLAMSKVLQVPVTHFFENLDQGSEPLMEARMVMEQAELFSRLGREDKQAVQSLTRSLLVRQARS